MLEVGQQIFDDIVEIYNFRRSLTGEGLRETLRFFKKKLPSMRILSAPTGKQVFDWKIPNEWAVDFAHIKNTEGETILDINDNFLHIVGYSRPVKGRFSRKRLLKKMHTSPTSRSAIPYVTSYYKKDWGFCCSADELENFNDPYYDIEISAELFPGELNYGELIIEGKSKKEILFSSYICHPNLANNELSGPLLQLALANYLSKIEKPYYTYRFIWVPETIGAINYIHDNLIELKANMLAGFVLTCVGDEGEFSYLSSPYANTLADKLAKKTFSKMNLNYQEYPFLERGSDERQFCSPLVKLPVVSVMKSKYGEYQEYHTSEDNLNFISAKGLGESYKYYTCLINNIEESVFPIAKHYCEPMLGKRNLYNNLSKVGSAGDSKDLLNFIAYSDGTNDLDDIAALIDVTTEKAHSLLNICRKNSLVG